MRMTLTVTDSKDQLVAAVSGSPLSWAVVAILVVAVVHDDRQVTACGMVRIVMAGRLARLYVHSW